MTQYILCGDGACSGNPGPGGFAWEIWAGEVREGNQIVSGSGEAAHTTNQVMELTAAAEGLEELSGKMPGSVLMHFDSEYVLKGIFEWLEGWKARGWRTASKKAVSNLDLWQRVDAAVQSLQGQGFTLVNDWIKGHDGDLGNERVDEEAVRMRDRAKVRLKGEADTSAETERPTGGLDLMAIARGEASEPDLENPAPQPDPSSVTAEQLRLMHQIIEGYNSGALSLSDAVREVRLSAKALGCA
jgi:ribonuclease HI